jgi:hypothetical protein
MEPKVPTRDGWQQIDAKSSNPADGLKTHQLKRLNGWKQINATSLNPADRLETHRLKSLNPADGLEINRRKKFEPVGRVGNKSIQKN